MMLSCLRTCLWYGQKGMRLPGCGWRIAPALTKIAFSRRATLRNNKLALFLPSSSAQGSQRTQRTQRRLVFLVSESGTLVLEQR